MKASQGQGQLLLLLLPSFEMMCQLALGICLGARRDITQIADKALWCLNAVRIRNHKPFYVFLKHCIACKREAARKLEALNGLLWQR